MFGFRLSGSGCQVARLGQLEVEGSYDFPLGWFRRVERPGFRVYG